MSGHKCAQNSRHLFNKDSCVTQYLNHMPLLNLRNLYYFTQAKLNQVIFIDFPSNVTMFQSKRGISEAVKIKRHWIKYSSIQENISGYKFMEDNDSYCVLRHI